MEPLGSPVPFRVAEVLVTPVAAVVVTAGGVGVVNERTDPNEVPTAFEAIAQ